MFILWLILEIFLTCFDVFYSFAIPIFQLGTKDWVKKKYCILYGLCFVFLITIYNYLTSNSISVLYISITSIIAFVFIFIKGKWIYKIFWVLFPAALVYGIEMLVFSLLTHIYQDISIDTFALQNMYRLQMVFLVKLIQLMILIFLLKKKIDLKEIGHFILIPIVVGISIIILGLSLLHLTEFLGKEISQKVLLNVAGAFLILNLGYLAVFVLLNKKNKEILKQKLQIQQMELSVKSHEELIANYKNFKLYQEKVNECLQIIWGLGKMEKVSDRETYLNQFSQINQYFSQLYYTGDEVLDGVLSSKETLAMQSNIQVKTNIQLPAKHPFQSVDLGSMLSHLLDNAIEAQQNLDKQREKYIQLAILVQGDCLCLEIENPVKEPEKRAPKELLSFSSKQNKGVGLKIVKELVERYQGTIELIKGAYHFKVRIKLPLKNRRQ